MSFRRPSDDVAGKWLLPIVIILALGVGAVAYVAVQRIGTGDPRSESGGSTDGSFSPTLGGDVPEPPGGLGYRRDSGAPAGTGTYGFVAKGGDPGRAAKGLVTFYQRQMPSKGWEVVVVPGSGPGGTLVFRKDDALAAFRISDDAHAQITLCPPAPRSACNT